MFKKAIIIVTTFLISVILLSGISTKSVKTPTTHEIFHNEMPILEEKNPLLANITNDFPVGQRSFEYIKWLQASFKIQTNDGSSGSGTLCYYDMKTNTAYVISCGHLWNGTASQTGEQANIITWYHNGIKLNNPKKYLAKVVFHSNNTGYDCSLLTFNPDWMPNIYYPIGTRELKKGERLHSVGCDKGSEVADYVIEVVEIGSDPRGGKAIITKYNSPRPGRSGGGLLDNKGYFLGICWATSQKDGTGVGYFTPLAAIHKVFTREGYSFLLNQSLPGVARRIPILDHNNPKRKYNENYIILPNS